MKLHLIQVKVSDKHEGEHLDHFALQEGDVVLIDRGYNQPKKLIEQVDQGVSVVLRYNPHGMNLYDREGQRIDWYDQLHDTAETSRCLSVRVYAEGQYIDGYSSGSYIQDTPSIYPYRLDRGIHAADGLDNSFQHYISMPAVCRRNKPAAGFERGHKRRAEPRSNAP